MSNRCARKGFLIDGHSALPTDPTEIDIEYLAVIGCSRLQCERCGVAVSNGVSAQTPSARRYSCPCTSYTETSSHPLHDPDPIPERDPLTPWGCAGHPPLTLPREVDGVSLGSEAELAATARRVLAGWTPPGAREADAERVGWLRRLHARLTPDLQDVLTRVALSRAVAPDPNERGRALIFFKNVRDDAALERLFALFAADRTPFTGIPDLISSVDGETLEHSLWRAVTPLAGREGRVRALARQAALEPGRGSRALYDLLASSDVEWLDAHRSAVEHATPEAADALNLSIACASPPPESVRRYAQAADSERSLDLDDPLQRAAHEGRVLLVREIPSYFASGSVEFARARPEDVPPGGLPQWGHLVLDEPLTDEALAAYARGPWDSPAEFWRFHEPERTEIEIGPKRKVEPPAARSWPLVEQVGELGRHQTACLRRICVNAILGRPPHSERTAELLSLDDPAEIVARTLDVDATLEDDLRDVALRISVPEPEAPTRDLLEAAWKPERGRWSLDGGVLHGTGRTRTEELFESFELGADVLLSAGHCYLGFRLEDHEGYELALGEGGWGRLRHVDARRGHVGLGQLPRLLVRADGWTSCFIRADGPHIRAWLNGVKTVDFTDPEGSPRGAIAFEVESVGAPPRAWFRNVRLAVLSCRSR